MEPIHPVILCGGGGTRLWPRSRKAHPKPFLPLLGDRTLFEQSLARVSDRADFAPPSIVAGAPHLHEIERQTEAFDISRLIIEPAARNTAPAIALAAHSIAQDAVMLVCPSDHYIADQQAFLDAARRAAELARDDWLVAFGIVPTRAETGYGYIKRGAGIAQGHMVERFVEKPDSERAKAFLAHGGYAWNGGIFAFRAGIYLAELAKYRPEMAAAAAQAMANARVDGREMWPDSGHFNAIEGESVDYAVMENTGRAAVVAADMEWSDIGNWDALKEARGGDASGNLARGPADFVDCRNVMADSDGPRISVVGLEDVIVVVDGGEVLVTSRAAAQQVGKLPGANGQ